MNEKRLFKHLSQTHALALKDHPQIQAMVDILSKQHHPHLIIKNCPTKKIQSAFMASLQQYLTTDAIPNILKNTKMMYVDMKQFEFFLENPKEIEEEYAAVYAEARQQNQLVTFVVSLTHSLLKDNHKLNQLSKLLKSMLTESQIRLIIFAPEKFPASLAYFEEFFTTLVFISLNRSEKTALLKSSRAELEAFYQVTMLDEVFPAALEMANKYLPNSSSLNSSFELLESAAARASITEHNAIEHKPIVTCHHLALVLANRTQVPLAHLQNQQFQIVKFIEVMQQRIFGHDAAIQVIASLLQTASLALHPKKGPYCSFLFAGPACVGKAALAEAMANYLFGHKNALLRIPFTQNASLLSDLYITLDNRCINLLAAVEQKPYAVLLLENSDQYSSELIENIKMVLAYGYALNAENEKIDFQHTIIMMTTTVGTDCIMNLSEMAPEKNKTLDILQLVLNEPNKDTIHYPLSNCSIAELRDELTGALAAHFSSHFLEYLHIIPFVPLEYASLEKIMHAKIKTLTKRLLTQFNIELTYAPEVVKFLAQEALWQRSNIKSLDHWLEQQLYSYITHAMLAHPERKEQSNQLLVRLNQSGQSLRCEFVTANETALYHL